MANPDPFGVQEELAQCRTLFCQFQDSIAANKEEMREAYLQVARETLQDQLSSTDFPEELSEWVVETVDTVYRNLYNAVFTPLARMTPKEAEVLAKVLKTTADIAEKFRRIQEGTVVQLDYNERMTQAMMQFIVRIVLPYVPLDKRPSLAYAAQQFLPALKGERVIIDAAGD